MKLKTLAAVALSNADYPDLQSKLREAGKWVQFAAAQGADLVVLPELLNQYYGDGPNNPRRPKLAEFALEDWKRDTQILLDAAAECSVAIALPLLIWENELLSNCYFLISKSGEVRGQYHKQFPTQLELDEGIVPGPPPSLIEWEGLSVGGAICFDTNFPEVFSGQSAAGADLFVVPSLWPGGSQLDFYALHYAAPIVLSYPAWSRIIDLDGKELAAGGYRSETLRFGFATPVICATLNFDRVALHADHNAPKIASLQRHYGPKLRTQFDQQNVLWIVESVDPELTIAQVITEFELEPRSQYLMRSREAVQQARAEQPLYSKRAGAAIEL